MHIVARRDEQPICDGGRVAYTNPNVALNNLRLNTAINEPVLTNATLKVEVNGRYTDAYFFG